MRPAVDPGVTRVFRPEELERWRSRSVAKPPLPHAENAERYVVAVLAALAIGWGAGVVTALAMGMCR